MRALPRITGASVWYVLIVWLSGAGFAAAVARLAVAGRRFANAGAGYLLHLAARIAWRRCAQRMTTAHRRSLARRALCQG